MFPHFSGFRISDFKTREDGTCGVVIIVRSEVKEMKVQYSERKAKMILRS